MVVNLIGPRSGEAGVSIVDPGTNTGDLLRWDGSKWVPAVGLEWDETNNLLGIAGKIASQSFEAVSMATQAIGTTDTIIEFPDDSSDPIWDVTTNIFTVKRTIPGSKAEIELNVSRTGGGVASVLQLWREISTDGGATFTPVPATLRQVTISNDGQGNFSFGASINQPISVGTKFKLVHKKISGGGTLTLSSPTGTNADTEALTGFAAKATIG